MFERVEVAFGRESQGLEVSRSDRFIATTWWSAHVAANAMRALGGGRFLYMIQEYEPFTFAMGTWAALARESYGFDHRALFSTELLRDYFRAHRLGVYAGGPKRGDRASASFQNAITPVAPPAARPGRPHHPQAAVLRAPRAPRRAQPVRAGAAGAGPRDRRRELRPRLGAARDRRGERRPAGAARWRRGARPAASSEQSAYAGVLRDHDVGLSLMYTPHPSLVPIEMASAGMLTVTNAFENKTPGAMAAISPNLITTEPTIEAIAAGLGEAAAAAADSKGARAARRCSGAGLGRLVDDALMDRVLALLDG